MNLWICSSAFPFAYIFDDYDILQNAKHYQGRYPIYTQSMNSLRSLRLKKLAEKCKITQTATLQQKCSKANKNFAVENRVEMNVQHVRTLKQRCRKIKLHKYPISVRRQINAEMCDMGWFSVSLIVRFSAKMLVCDAIFVVIRLLQQNLNIGRLLLLWLNLRAFQNTWSMQNFCYFLEPCKCFISAEFTDP